MAQLTFTVTSGVFTPNIFKQITYTFINGQIPYSLKWSKCERRKHLASCPDTGSPLSGVKLNPGEKGFHMSDEVIWHQVAYHGKAHICLFEGWPIIGAIPSHSHHLPLLTSRAVDNAWNTEWVSVRLKLSALVTYRIIAPGFNSIASSPYFLQGSLFSNTGWHDLVEGKVPHGGN